MKMKFSTIALICTAFLLTMLTTTQAWIRGSVDLFAVLPPGSTGPEGLAVGPDGNIYVTTFGFNAAGPVSGLGQLYVFGQNGKLIRQVGVVGSTSHLLGIGFHPTTHALLVIDFGNARVLNVNLNTGASSVFMTVPTAPASTGLNALTFDKAGNVYVSDSFNGIIWKTGPSGSGAGNATAWVTDPLLATTGVPPFGANGLGFNKAGDTLFVANTGNDTIVKIPVTSGSPGKPEVFVNSINGADGLVLDSNDNLWVAANQADEIIVVDPTGKAIAKLGDFNGVDKSGVPQGLLFPASPDFSKDGNFLYISNLALDLRLFGLAESVDSQWTHQVQRYTISRITARIPPVGPGSGNPQ
jgi:sugar lactone lactonase YvrE